MPAHVMSRFPHLVTAMEAVKLKLQMDEAHLEMKSQAMHLGLSLMKNAWGMSLIPLKTALSSARMPGAMLRPLVSTMERRGMGSLERVDTLFTKLYGNLTASPKATQTFLSLFTDPIPDQDWSVAYDTSNVMLDLPGMRLIDISTTGPHRVGNYTVVFAPRAGHHSNIAERVALSMRNQGLTRMAIVEQKCADDIPLYVDGKRHWERFEGQLEQYRQILETLKRKSGLPSHLVAICQPGPLLMSAVIRWPELARTFGSAGSPMDTEAEQGFLTDFSRSMGPHYMDTLYALFGKDIDRNHTGHGRPTYDGALHVLGFYLLGMESHLQNFRKLFSDLMNQRNDEAEKQIRFYQWYNYVIHFPQGFIRDTYKKIFVYNQLARGTLVIGGEPVRMADYPGHVPIWALGGARDNIAPPGQAVGHFRRITSVPEKDRLSMVCQAGHMGLFRSSKILREVYPEIVSFLMERSDTLADAAGA